MTLPLLLIKPEVDFANFPSSIHFYLGKCMEALCKIKQFEYSIELQDRVFISLVGKEGSDKVLEIFREYVVIKNKEKGKQNGGDNKV